MKIKTTSCDFFTLLKKEYANKVILGKRSAREVIENLKENYKMLLICDIEKLDDIARLKIEEFKDLIDANNNNFKGDYIFDIYQLTHNIHTNKFYKYYHDRFEGNNEIYIYHETKTEKLFSNCDLLELKLTILSGIDEFDVQNDTREYLSYLNDCYQYEVSE